MKLFQTSTIAQIDQYTIEHEPISDVDLMERASSTICDYLRNDTNFSGEVILFCGPGNNGGDGLALGRMLANQGIRFSVKVYKLDLNCPLKGSSAINLKRLKENTNVEIHFLNEAEPLPYIFSEDLVIDALFGSGLNRPLEGFPATIVKYINQSGANVLSIDIPSGLMGEDNSGNIAEHIIRATQTITFQFPKICFLLPENEKYVGNWIVKNIGLHPDAILSIPTNFYLFDDTEAHRMIRNRNKFSHKGTFGHALLIAGAYGKMGAAVLASKACLRSGVGLLTTHIPHTGYSIIQNTIPEAMTSIDDSDLMFTNIEHLDIYQAIGIGPGIGTKVNTCKGVKKLIEHISHKQPIVVDADALNILGSNKEWLNILPENSILTPHPKEFERLSNPATNGYQRMKQAINFAQKYRVILVVKGAHSMVVNPQGEVWFNSTGNPGMATAGSGDVLTGIILGLIAQGYSPFDGARLGVYLHGLAGDLAAAQRGYEALIASDLIENLGEAFKLTHKC